MTCPSCTTSTISILTLCFASLAFTTSSVLWPKPLGGFGKRIVGPWRLATLNTNTMRMAATTTSRKTTTAPTPLADLPRSLDNRFLRRIEIRKSKLENRGRVSIFEFRASSVGIASGSRFDDLNAQAAKIHAVGMAFQPDVTLVGNPAQRTLLGKNKRRIVKVNFMYPIPVQKQRQAPADAGNLHLVPLAGSPRHTVKRDHRA